MKKFFTLALLLASIFILAPSFVFANGGDQRIVENKYFINLSRAPFTPRVGAKTAMLPSFFDIQKNKLVAEDLLVKVRIYRFGGSGEEKRVLLFEKKDVLVKGGVLEGLSYTFTESGIHEIFFDFTFASEPGKVYEAPDFLIDVQESKIQTRADDTVFLFVSAGTLLGFLSGWLIGRRQRQKKP